MKIVIYLLGFACIAYCTYFNLYTRQAANCTKKYVPVLPAKISGSYSSRRFSTVHYFHTSGRVPLAFLDSRYTGCY
jgi:hypothetical protein